MQETVYDMKKAYPNEPVEILLEGYDLSTTLSEKEKVRKLWEEGKSLYEIADIIRPTNRGYVETLLLLIHMGDKGEIGEREGYLWGK